MKLQSFVLTYVLMLVLAPWARHSQEPGIIVSDPFILSGFQKDSAIFVADPFVLKEGDTYYLYGTGDSRAGLGIPVYTSKDMIHWTGPMGKASNGLCLAKGQSFGDKGFWAPFVLKVKKKFYMYYTANEQVAVAVSDSPLGPFTQQSMQPMHSGFKEIDPHVFTDKNGKRYLYTVRLQAGNRIFGAVLNDNLTSIDEKSVVECINYSQEWEVASGKRWPVTEAPALLKHKDLYYLFYTANDFRDPNYNVGYAVSKTPLGPWKKSDANPIIPKTEGIQGTGHCELMQMSPTQWVMFYHTHFSTTKVGPRRTAYSKIHFTPGKDGIDVPTVDTLKQFCYY